MCSTCPKSYMHAHTCLSIHPYMGTHVYVNMCNEMCMREALYRHAHTCACAPPYKDTDIHVHTRTLVQACTSMCTCKVCMGMNVYVYACSFLRTCTYMFMLEILFMLALTCAPKHACIIIIQAYTYVNARIPQCTYAQPHSDSHTCKRMCKRAALCRLAHTCAGAHSGGL